MAKKGKNYNRFITTAATATLVASALVPVASADVPTSTSKFKDVSGHYKVPVDYLFGKGIIKGISKDHFGTAQDIKRVDVAVMIARALYTEEEIASAPDAGFIDVHSRATNSINKLKEMNIINGKSVTQFDSDASITRGEMAIMLSNAYTLTGDVNNLEFTDVSNSYKNAVAALVENNITKGKGDKKFGTSEALTRGELAIFLYKAETLAEVVEEIEVTSIQTISETGVNLTIKAAAAVEEAATVEVKNSLGVVVPVTDLAVSKDTTALMFNFVTPVENAELVGIWSVNGIEYNFTTAKQLSTIKKAAKATPLIATNLIASFANASITNVIGTNAAAYATALNAETAKVETLTDVQAIVSSVNTAKETLVKINSVTAESTDADVLVLLQNTALELEDVIASSVTEYKAELVKADVLTAEILQELIKNVNIIQNEIANLASVNEATSAIEMRTALTAVATAVELETYSSLSVQAKLDVANHVLVQREESYASLTDVQADIDSAIDGIAAFITKVNGAPGITKMKTALSDTVFFPEYNALATTVAKNEAAESVQTALRALQAQDPRTEFKTISEIRTAAGL